MQEGLTLVESKATEILTPEPRIAALRRSNPLWKKSPSISPRVSMRNSVDKPNGTATPEGTGLSGDLQLKASRDVSHKYFLLIIIILVLYFDGGVMSQY
jgi:hypothetical protein